PKGRKLVVPCVNFDLDLLYLRSEDIPEYVSRGTADFGIVGENLLYEKKPKVKKLRKLGFGECKLIIAVPADSDIKTLKDLEGERIATSYPETLKTFLEEKSISASIIFIKGSCEIAPTLNLADAICDITQTGETLHENDLRILTQVLESEACLIESPIVNPQKDNFLQLCKL
ncbi:MAG: ATP phosphoribosyltransferase, partial [Candidatus Gracilibacteria bacterium]|nr:ATP phosphoribosyltransferase [Candidatus Gracilibacteria bacterium]